MPGFDKTRFVDVSEQDLEEYSCGICLEVFNKPLFSQCCRQTYCSDCITQWLTQHNTCPNDRKPLTVNDLCSPPRFAINVWNKLKIKCDFDSNGCKMILVLDQLSIHSEKCDYNPRNWSKICESCALLIQSDHNCIENLKVKNESINDEMRQRLRHELQELEKLQGSQPTFDRNDRTVRIIEIKMEETMKNYAVSIGLQALDQFKEDLNPNGKLASFVINQLENKFMTQWNCVVSADIYFDFNLYLPDNYIEFEIGQVYFVIWEIKY